MAGRFRAVLAKRPGLIVSLPRNDLTLARSAWEHGADALKVHLNVTHAAAGTGFGTWDTERPALTPIFEASPIPVGVMIGAERVAAQSEVQELIGLGMDFVDLYAHRAPDWLSGITADRMLAVDPTYDDAAVRAVAARGATLLEAAIVPHEQYGQPFAAVELDRYRALGNLTGLPVVVPTQRALTPDDARRLVREAGVAALMIGVIVAGDTAASIGAATARFRTALDG